MKKYSVHFICILLILVFLYFLTTESVKMALDPTYRPIGRYIPRALVWYFCIFLWFSCLTIAFKIEIAENGSIKTISILKKEIIFPDNIISIKDSFLSYTVVHTLGKTKVSNLIDGVKNIKTSLLGLTSCTIDQKTDSIERAKREDIGFGKMFIKIAIALFLIGFALYIELDHFSRIAQ